MLRLKTLDVMPAQERFPDPERGAPSPGHGGDWYGHHMVISGSSFVPLGLEACTVLDLELPQLSM